MAAVSTERAVEIFRQHKKRLQSNFGKEQTEEGDLFVQALLPTLDSCLVVLSGNSGRGLE